MMVKKLRMRLSKCPCRSTGLQSRSGDLLCTIKAAVAAVAIILVGPGVYQEDVTINKDLTLLGANSDVNPNEEEERGEESVIKGKLTLKGENSITVKGFKFFNDTVGENNQTALAINGAGTYTVENCIFERDPDTTSVDWSVEKNLAIRGIEISSASAGCIDIRNNLFTGSDADIYSNSS